MASEPPEGVPAPVVVEVRGLRKSYSGVETVHVLRGIDLDVRRGEFAAVMGRSGSGKSTLLNILGALDRPTEGSLRVAGRELARMDEEELALFRSTRMGFVFQFHHLLDELTCLENALLPITIRKGIASRADVERVRGLLEMVDLGSRLHHRPGRLSGGQQQRAAIIRALANEPSVVLADEPTGNLDADAATEVFRIFRLLTRRSGVAVIMVTHDERLARAADRLIRIDHGLAHEVSRRARAAEEIA